MDYPRIYASFVESRRNQQGALKASGEYFERHHVLPVSLGGGNEASNLVALTAREHYFAHCCLAKIHGGKMWSALFSLANMTKVDEASRYFLRARIVELSRREAASVRRASMTQLWASGEFVRDRVYGPISEAHRQAVRAAASRPKSSASIAKRVASRRAVAKVFEFRHTETGQVFKGTQAEFCEASGVGQALASCLTRGKINSAKRWVLDGAEPKSIFGRDPVIRRFVHCDGQSFVGTVYEFRTSFSLDSGVVSNLVNGKNRVKSFKGWRYEGEA